MKTMNIALIATLILTGTLLAQEISNEEWRNMSRQERKEYKQKVAEANQLQLMQVLTAKAWVLEAHTIQDRYGKSLPIEPTLNFVGVSGEYAAAQLGSSSEIGWNGVGGITVEGKVAQYKIEEGKKPGTGAYIRIEISGLSAGHLSMSINTMADGTASATVSDNYGERLTYRGRIVPLAESTVFKGQVVY